MAWRIPLSDVPIDEEAVGAATDAMRSGWWSMGPRVEAFEEQFASFCGLRHAFAVSNGTSALHAALLAVGCGPGDTVVLPSLTFVAAANTVVHTGARPIFCDIVGDDDLNLDVDDVVSAIDPTTKAIVAFHYGGHPCDMGALTDAARNLGIAVVEDAAHAPGATLAGVACGSLGDIACFSFFSNKNLPVGEGGMIVTDDPDLADRVRLLRSHGMTTLTWERHRGHAHAYDVVAHGLNLRLDEVRAAIASVHLKRLAEWNDERARLAERYRAALDGIPGLRMPFGDDPDGTQSAHHLAVVVLAPGISRDEVREGLTARGIQSSVHYPPIHSFTAFERYATRPLPRTESVADRILTLPLYPGVGDDGVDAVVDALKDLVSDPARSADTARLRLR